MSAPETVSLTLLGRSFRIAAPAGEEARLRHAAAAVERLCEQIAAGLARPELERVLLLAALELAADGSGPSGETTQPDQALEARLSTLRERIEQALADTGLVTATR